MTGEQIRQLDRCRSELKSLYTASDRIKTELNPFGSGGNQDCGKEINELYKNLKAEINNSIMECEKGINKLISEI